MSYGRVVSWRRRLGVVVGADGQRVWIYMGAWSEGVIEVRARDCLATSKLVPVVAADVS